MKALTPSKNTVSTIGTTAFIVGVILALAGGVVVALLKALSIGGDNPGAIVTGLLIIAGLVVGFLNITDSEMKDFLLAAVVLVIVTSQGATLLVDIAIIGEYLATVLIAIMTFIIPATLVAGLKMIYGMAKDE